jgi:hypothetical protein
MGENIKPIVRYNADENLSSIVVGERAAVIAVDHPNFKSYSFVRTSKVLKVNEETGEFETVNSIYTLDKGSKND